MSNISDTSVGHAVVDRMSKALRIAAARLLQSLGAAGVVGLGLTLVAALVMGLAWHTHNAPLPEIPMPSAAPPALASAASEPAAASVLPLPGRADVPLLLTQIQQAALSQGLGWPAADYKLTPASDAAPAALEVRCSLKGPYPRLRAMLAELLNTVPGLAIRDLALSRTSAQVADVEAKLVLVVFLQDDAAAPMPSASSRKSAP